MQLHDVLALVRDFTAPGDAASGKSQELILGMLEHTSAPFERTQYEPGHLTATAMVRSPDGGRVLLIHHRRLDRWLLPGGHVEREDSTAGDSARREAIEETGVALSLAAPQLIGMDVHGIPLGKGEPFHLHHDLLFAFRATDEALRVSEESRAVLWASPTEFDQYAVPPNVRLAWDRLLGR